MKYFKLGGILLYIKMFWGLLVFAQEYEDYPMWNPALPMEKRVNDLVNRLTLEEKAAQMLNAAPAIARLGIPAYDWWNEVLHGVARTPYYTTVYPQAIGMAATWDTNSLKTMARYSAIEGRAVFNKATREGRNNERYLGLTYWTPNINIFRDPRWGRGQETYGEDPYLTAKLGASFVRGLQGNDPKYLLAAACAKHYAVHSGPEPSRHSDNFDVTEYELWDTYLPAFRELIVDANVAGVMCAYNAFRTQPCCANDYLMNDILRNKWKFKGYVTSDCWALDDFFKFHKTHPNAVSAAVDGLVHGTDLECGVSVYSRLVEAVKSGKITEAMIDQSVKRLFMIRFRLGMFDPANIVPYAQTSDNMLEAAAHKEHALKMARQSIVLLKNSPMAGQQRNILPLSKSLKKIAVIGPNADNKISVLGNYNGIPSKIVSVLDGIKEKLGKDVEVVYEQAIQFTNDTLFVADATIPKYSYDGQPGFKVEYWNNENLSGKAVVAQQVPLVDFNYFEGQPPVHGVSPNHYTARFTTSITAEDNETLVWKIEGDDGYRLIVNGDTTLNAWTRNRWGARIFKLDVVKGKTYQIILEHRQGGGGAHISMVKGNFRKTDFDALAEKLSTVDAIIFAGGISPQLEGEEMPVNVPGFLGGDRTSILLPGVQTELMQKLVATSKPVVFVMLTGSAIATPWESEHIPAILNAWYGGQSAGTAVADVLFGDYNPAGRLPVTFYRSDADLPGFMDYGMQNRTYRYFNGEALYPFGYGLSYTTYAYSNIKVPATVPAGKPIVVTTTLKNTGNADGEEVVQLYVSHEGANRQVPLKSLKGFKRVALKKGESKQISFTLTPSDLSVVGDNGNLNQPKGKVNISVGGGQPGVKVGTTSNVVTEAVIIL